MFLILHFNLRPWCTEPPTPGGVDDLEPAVIPRPASTPLLGVERSRCGLNLRWEKPASSAENALEGGDGQEGVLKPSPGVEECGGDEPYQRESHPVPPAHSAGKAQAPRAQRQGARVKPSVWDAAGQG